MDEEDEDEDVDQDQDQKTQKGENGVVEEVLEGKGDTTWAMAAMKKAQP